MSMKVALRQNLNRNKRQWWIYGGIVAAVIIIGIYIGCSVMAWSAFDRKTTETVSIIHEKTDKAFKQKVTDAKNRQEKIQAIEAVYASVLEQKPCEIGAIYRWQQAVIGSLKASTEKCEVQLKKLHGFSNSVNNMMAYLKNERQLAGILSEVTTASALADAEWGTALQKWTDAEKKVTQLSSVDSFTASKQLAVQRISSVKAAWQEVIAASQAKDRKRYEAATVSLGQTYAALVDIKGASEAGLLLLIDKVNSSYRQAFKNQ